MAGDDARDIFAGPNGDAQRLFTLPDDLVGDGHPNQGHDDGNGRHQLDAKLADGRRTHSSGNGPLRDALTLCLALERVNREDGLRATRAASNPLRPRRAAHSALAPEAVTTFSHFAVSAAMTLPKSSGEPLIGVPPNSTRRLSIPGSESAAFADAFTLSIASRGEPFGMPSPNHAVAS